jgi:hypothetical protein
MATGKGGVASLVVGKTKLKMGQRMGMKGYIALYAALSRKPMSAAELIMDQLVGHNAVYRYLVTLHALGELHVVDWRVQPNIRAQPVYAAGPGQDAPLPLRPNGRPSAGPNKARRRALSPALIAFASLLRSLREPICRAELREETGYTDYFIGIALRALMKNKLARITSWVRESNSIPGPPRAYYQLGSGPNAKRPPRLTRSQIHYRQKARLASLSPLLAIHRALTAPAANVPSFTQRAHA